MSDNSPIGQVMVTGATGFVGRAVVRELLSRGLTPVCLVRSTRKLFDQHPEVDPDRLRAVSGNLADHGALAQAAEQSDAAIHLVGIIMARRLAGQSFAAIHTQGTRSVVDAVARSGSTRFVHLSALGTRADALSAYHRTKWAAEQHVINSGLEWTILRPGLIHGPNGMFMRMMKRMVCKMLPPLHPYFGSGQAKVQPVSVKDVAYCCVESLFRDDAIGKVFPMGGPSVYTWIELYNAFRAMIPGAKHWKPLVSLPVAVAKLIAAVSAPPMAVGELLLPSLGMFRFDAGQVDMCQEDCVCDHTVVERAFGIRMRSFEDEMSLYADLIP